MERSSMSSPVTPDPAALVIAYGNPLRQDDALGWYVAERLIADGVDGVDVVTCHQLTPELAEPISQAAFVVFVDALMGEVPGQVQCQPISAAMDGAASFTHDLSPKALLALALELFGSQPPGWLIIVTGDAFGHGTGLSPSVKAAVEPAVRCIQNLVIERPTV
jgi:hydrogenase maturation protease